jgi:hypothetical protein
MRKIDIYHISISPSIDDLLGEADGLLGEADGLLGEADGLLGEADGLLGEADGLSRYVINCHVDNSHTDYLYLGRCPYGCSVFHFIPLVCFHKHRGDAASTKSLGNVDSQHHFCDHG